MSEIRRATIDDLAAIEHIVAEAFAAYVPRMGMRPAPMDDDYGARIAAGEVEVCVDGDGIAGVLVLVIGGDEAKLEIVAVAERMRGRGLGRRLVVHAEAASRAAGCARISLYTHETMTENRAIYPRLGYVETHRARQDGFDRVFFSRTLAPLPGRPGAPTGGRG